MYILAQREAIVNSSNYILCLLYEGGWPASAAVGNLGGSVSVSPLDWTLAIEEQVDPGGPDARHADVILAAETVWLEELVDPFVHTVLDILKGRSIPLQHVHGRARLELLRTSKLMGGACLYPRADGDVWPPAQAMLFGV